MQKKNQKPSAGIWLDSVNPSREEIEKIFEKYGFHELDRDAILEEHQYARIDAYENYLFLVLHFPKYNPTTERYIQNELDIFVGPDYILTFRYYPSATMKNVFSLYEKRQWTEKEDDNDPAFILYDIIEAYLTKTMKMLERFSRDLKIFEKEMLVKQSRDTIRTLMIRKRNIITLKHMMKPQIPVLRQTENYIKWRFDEEVEHYFESLEDKLDKIFSEIQLIEENIESLEDTLKSMFDFETNITMKYLTIFSAFMLPLTLATSFFGMNIEEGSFNNLWIIVVLILTLFVTGGLMYLFFVRKNR